MTAKGKDLKKPRAKCLYGNGMGKFDNKYMRHDIGKAIDEEHKKNICREVKCMSW